MALFYGVGLFFDRRNGQRRRIRLKLPVVSIGNLSLGGTGKTPVLIRLAADLKNEGIDVAVLTRGYRGPGRGPSPSQILIPGEPFNETAFSDEVRLLREKLPQTVVGVGPDRVANAEAILERRNVDGFLLDDGFQHWAVERDWDVVCVDASDPWGGSHLIPWGRLREPFSEIKRAGLIILTRTELVPSATLDTIESSIRLHTKAPILRSEYKRLYSQWNMKEPRQSTVKNKKVLAVSAVGNPSAYEEGLRRDGADVTPRRFLDHHNYNDRDVAKMGEWVLKTGGDVVITEKDFVKLRHLNVSILPLWLARQELTFPGPQHKEWENFISQIKSKMVSAKGR